VQAQWPLLAGSFLLRVQQIRVFLVYLRGRCALAAAGQSAAESARLISAAEKDAARLDREQMPWSAGLAALVHAGVATARGDAERAKECFGLAADLLDKVSMSLHAAAARRRHGLLLGGDAGRLLVDQADGWMAEQTVQNSERLANMFAPGG
jgi:hypothetical protein